MFTGPYFQVGKEGVSQFQLMTAYLGGSAFQTVVDNPVTAYRQLVQQYAKNSEGKLVDPKVAVAEANVVFRKNPIAASLSGVLPRLAGVCMKRVPKFGAFIGISFLSGKDGRVGLMEATGASILSAPFINPIRIIEKQQRIQLKTHGKIKSVIEIIRESAEQRFRPLLRGTTPLIAHSLASATLGLVGQPALQSHIQTKLQTSFMLQSSFTNLLASCIVSPIYVMITNPISRLEVIMQTNSISGKAITLREAVKELRLDTSSFGVRGLFRGNGVGIVKAIISLSLFHEGRILYKYVERV